jgi:hypothetical protein
MTWFGGIALAVGLPCWLQGILMDLQVAAMLAKVTNSNALPESVQHTTEWLRESFWLGPYLLWIGGALTLAGCAFVILGLMIAHKDDNVDIPAGGHEQLNP